MSSSGQCAYHMSQGGASSSDWFLDTGADTHVTSELLRLNSLSPYQDSKLVTFGSGQSLPIAHTCSGYVYTPLGTFYLGNLSQVPSIKL